MQKHRCGKCQLSPLGSGHSPEGCGDGEYEEVVSDSRPEGIAGISFRSLLMYWLNDAYPAPLRSVGWVLLRYRQHSTADRRAYYRKSALLPKPLLLSDSICFREEAFYSSFKLLTHLQSWKM